MVAQAIPHKVYPIYVYRINPSQDNSQIHSGTSAPTPWIPSGPPPTIHQVTPSSTWRWACSPAGLNYSVPRQLVHERGHVLPHRVTRRPPHPPTASLEMAAAFQQPVDVHVVVDFWRFRWPQFFRHVFVVFGARPGRGRVRRVCGDTRSQDMGPRAGNRNLHRRLLRPHGRWSDLGACVLKGRPGVAWADFWDECGPWCGRFVGAQSWLMPGLDVGWPLLTLPRTGFDRENCSSRRFRTYDDLCDDMMISR